MIKKTLFVIAASILALGACHKCNDPGNPACSNYDPCYGKAPISAAFTMQDYNSRNNGWIPYITDTVTGGSVLFTALLDNAEYEWHIGADIYTTQTVNLSFASLPNGSNIPIMLIVKKAPNLKCFPGDPGIDTMIKNMYISWTVCRVFGSYYGYLSDSPSHKFAITIENSVPPPSWYNFAMSHCGVDTLIQTYGWPIPASLVSGSYPCDRENRGLRELLFDVQPPDSILYVDSYTTYSFCAALLDSTYNNININVVKIVPKNDGSNGSNIYKINFKGTRL